MSWFSLGELMGHWSTAQSWREPARWKPTATASAATDEGASFNWMRLR